MNHVCSKRQCKKFQKQYSRTLKSCQLEVYSCIQQALDYKLMLIWRTKLCSQINKM
uniref:Uncharacterized protein n=1 Tax=Arundo donax TaxID=35708 RepID=A0A0A9HXV0_ARUDO